MCAMLCICVFVILSKVEKMYGLRVSKPESNLKLATTPKPRIRLM